MSQPKIETVTGERKDAILAFLRSLSGMGAGDSVERDGFEIKRLR